MSRMLTLFMYDYKLFLCSAKKVKQENIPIR